MPCPSERAFRTPVVDHQRDAVASRPANSLLSRLHHRATPLRAHPQTTAAPTASASTKSRTNCPLPPHEDSRPDDPSYPAGNYARNGWEISIAASRRPRLSQTPRRWLNATTAPWSRRPSRAGSAKSASGTRRAEAYRLSGAAKRRGTAPTDTRPPTPVNGANFSDCFICRRQRPGAHSVRSRPADFPRRPRRLLDVRLPVVYRARISTLARQQHLRDQQPSRVDPRHNVVDGKTPWMDRWPAEHDRRNYVQSHRTSDGIGTLTSGPQCRRPTRPSRSGPVLVQASIDTFTIVFAASTNYQQFRGSATSNQPPVRL